MARDLKEKRHPEDRWFDRLDHILLRILIIVTTLVGVIGLSLDLIKGLIAKIERIP